LIGVHCFSCRNFILVQSVLRLVCLKCFIIDISKIICWERAEWDVIFRVHIICYWIKLFSHCFHFSWERSYFLRDILLCLNLHVNNEKFVYYLLGICSKFSLNFYHFKHSFILSFQVFFSITVSSIIFDNTFLEFQTDQSLTVLFIKIKLHFL
jgi:hypothetical protein